MPILRITILGFLTIVFSFFAWGFYHQEVVMARRVNTVFVEGTCVVLGIAVQKYETGGDRSTRPRSVQGYTAHVNIRYSVDGTTYETGTLDGQGGYYDSWEDATREVSQFQRGETYPCWYDPEDPSRVVVIRRESYAGNYLAFGVMSLLASVAGSWLIVSVWAGITKLVRGGQEGPADRGPCCGRCNAPLRTPQAQQCFECGYDWH